MSPYVEETSGERNAWTTLVIILVMVIAILTIGYMAWWVPSQQNTVVVPQPPVSTPIFVTPGPQGQQGPAGTPAPQGAQGPSGTSGPSGAAGPSGATGATGATGADGSTGPTGAAGTPAPEPTNP